MATVFRPPLSTRREPVARSVDINQPSPLTLRTVGAPFRQTQWPNPRGPRYPEQPGQNEPLTLRTVGAPFRWSDWQNPRGAVFPLENRGFENFPVTLLNVGAPFHQGDWPNPLSRKNPLERVQMGSPITLSTVAAVQSPFGLTDFPNPQRRQSVLQDQQLNTLPIRSITYANMPFGAQWETPARKPIVPVKVDVNTLQLLTQVVVQFPFGAQWDNPWRPIFKPLPQAIGGTLGLTPVYVDRAPTVRRIDRLQQTNYGYVQGSLLALNGPPPTKPFLQTQWPNPLPLKWWRFDHQQAGCSLALVTPITKPFNLTDWQNPLPAKWWRIDYQQAGCSLALVTPPTKPFNVTDWPNPVIQLRAQQPQILPLPLTFPYPDPVIPPEPEPPVSSPSTNGGGIPAKRRRRVYIKVDKRTIWFANEDNAMAFLREHELRTSQRVVAKAKAKAQAVRAPVEPKALPALDLSPVVIPRLVVRGSAEVEEVAREIQVRMKAALKQIDDDLLAEEEEILLL